MALIGFTSLGVPLLGTVFVVGPPTPKVVTTATVVASLRQPHVQFVSPAIRVQYKTPDPGVAIPPHFVAEHIAPAPCCVRTTNSRESWATTSGLTHVCDSIFGTGVLDFTIIHLLLPLSILRCVVFLSSTFVPSHLALAEHTFLLHRLWLRQVRNLLDGRRYLHLFGGIAPSKIIVKAGKRAAAVLRLLSVTESVVNHCCFLLVVGFRRC